MMMMIIIIMQSAGLVAVAFWRASTFRGLESESETKRSALELA